eukprot:CAMPEP_0206171410 /NCGR_PEP_ID=MMETSP1474-20131121/42191_1 /ASSEMBLY_ACC=CAM_ASM_001110 /TAXON_ID=97495 /ORGANISM="Imantonia sp., Strain RCC918" /LENGTH=195 /DNA_ID=CAMNT_0053578827 /DNA_START=38 /DNA_END=626 /DNA_ORIENTATION=-
MNIDTVENVPDALSELFDRLDTSRQGSITLTDFTSTWTAGHENKEYGGQWEARQARAGARRIRRLFGCDGPDGCATDLKKEDFVSHFQGEYDKRMARGLPERRAVAEILCNIPQRALFAEMYGSEELSLSIAVCEIPMNTATTIMPKPPIGRGLFVAPRDTAGEGGRGLSPARGPSGPAGCARAAPSTAGHCVCV